MGFFYNFTILRHYWDDNLKALLLIFVLDYILTFCLRCSLVDTRYTQTKAVGPRYIVYY